MRKRISPAQKAVPNVTDLYFFEKLFGNKKVASRRVEYSHSFNKRKRKKKMSETSTYLSGELDFGPVFSDPSTVALSNTEVLQILGSIKNDLEAYDKPISDNLMRTLQHCERMGNHVDTHKVEETRRILQEKEGPNGKKLHTFEIAQLINLAPFDDAENAHLLIGSLGKCDEEFLKEVVDEVNKLQDL